jgi:MFS family permease
VIELRVKAPMVDFSFFRSRSFFGANLVAFIVSFAMLAMFFFIALYMQNVLHYSPLQAGVRFLPATALIMVVAPLSGRLTDRIGPRPLIVFGLLCVAGALFWQSHVTISSGYGTLLGGFLLMGVGMGFTMSPMSTAGMNAVDRTKAGVASGVLSMSRMVGGSFGVATIGALVAGVGRSQLDKLIPAVPAAQRHTLAETLGSGALPHAGNVGHAVTQAFVTALGDGLRLGAAIAFVGAIVALVFITPKVASAPSARPDASQHATQTGDEPVAAREPVLAGG